MPAWLARLKGGCSLVSHVVEFIQRRPDCLTGRGDNSLNNTVLYKEELNRIRVEGAARVHCEVSMKRPLPPYE